MAVEETRKGHCPSCGADRNADIKGDFAKRWDDDSGVWTQFNYRILQCRGCEEVYFQKTEVFSEDAYFERNSFTGEEKWLLDEKVSHWPAPVKRKTPDWLLDLVVSDKDLFHLVSDIYTALNNDLRVLAAIGTRTAFDRASELLGVDTSLTFQKKLEALVEQGKIGAAEKEVLSVLTDAGSAAAHRGWKPTPHQLSTMMSLIEAFLYRAFILVAEAKSLRAKIPARGGDAPTKALDT